jgi:putative FmdB family regulatory protein
MPYYEYSCQGCGHEFEVEQRITEAPLRQCTKCGAERAFRTISTATFVLKGGGWYADGYSGAGVSTRSSSSK